MYEALSRTWCEPAIPASVPTLRGQVVAFAAEAAMADPPLEDLRLAVSEALTNVVLHSYRDRPTPGPVEVTATAEDSALRLVVADEGVGMVPRLDSPGAGMGLPLISAVAQRMEIRAHTPRGTELHICFDY